MTRRCLALAVAVVTCAPLVGAAERDEHWVATWGPALVVRNVPGAGRGTTAPPAAPASTATAPAATPAPPPAPPGPPPLVVRNRTIRQIAHVSLGGNRVRLVLSNAFGTAPVAIEAAHIAVRECADARPGCTRSSDAAIVAPAKEITVNGNPRFVLVPGGSLVSDPVSLTVAPLSDVVIDMYLADLESLATSPLTWHSLGMQTAFISADGNVSGTPALNAALQPASWFFLSRIEVAAPEKAGVLVAFGDSITDGTRSTPNTNNRWPDLLARRLAGRKGRPMAVVNAGISGNMLLRDGAGTSALARFDRDVLMQTGVTHVVVLEGINDIGQARANPMPSAQDLIAVQRQLIARAHARGLKIYGATLTPFEGATYYTPEGEAKRAAVNTWIRTSGEYDGVIDFDKMTRDPASPGRFLAQFDSGDHLHPSDAGYQAMAGAIDLGLFK